jgi:hypothetical protein
VFKNLLIVAIATLTQAAIADNLYRYKNELGGTVVDWQVPVEFIAKGYEVLDENGRVIEIVPRQLTAEEMDDQDLIARLKRDAVVEKQRLAEWDQQLLLRYSTVEDIEAAHQRALSELKIRLSILASNQRSLKARLESYLVRIAEAERRGREASEADLRSIAAIRREIETNAKSITERRLQSEEVTASFEQDKERFAQIQDVVLLRRSLSRGGSGSRPR